MPKSQLSLDDSVQSCMISIVLSNDAPSFPIRATFGEITRV